MGVGAWRIAGGAVALGALALLAYGRDGTPERRDVPRFIACALLGVVINQGLFLVGLSRSTPMNAGLVMTLIPVFTFAVASAVGQERFSPLRALGVAIALAGATPLLFGQNGGFIGEHTFGNALMVTNALSYSLYLVISKRLLARYPAIMVIGWVYIFSLLFLPLFVVNQKLVPDTGQASAWWSLAYVIALPTVIAYLLNMFALERVRATTTAIYIYLQPIITGIASWILFGERLTPAIAVAAVLLFVGIWLVARRPPASNEATVGPAQSASG